MTLCTVLHLQRAAQTASSGLSPPPSPPQEGWVAAAVGSDGPSSVKALRIGLFEPPRFLYLHLGGRRPPWSPSLCLDRKHSVKTKLLFLLLVRVNLSTTEQLAKHLQSPGLLLAEDPHQEVGLMMRLEGGGDQQVVSGWKSEALRDLPGVYVGAAASLGAVVAEEVLAGLVFVFWSLNTDTLNQT